MGAAEGHLTHDDFEVWIVVGETTQPIFGVEYKEGGREATAWIPSEEGKTFSVCYRKTLEAQLRDNHALAAYVFLDGHRVSGTIIDRHDPEYYSGHKVSHVEVSATEIRDFVFNVVEFTDDDTLLSDPSTAHVGEIKVILRPVQKWRDESAPSYSRFAKFHDTGKIHERSKKGLVHQVKYSETKTRPSYNPRQWSSIPMGDPITFAFKYRPLGVLQAMGIAPRPASPSKSKVGGLKLPPHVRGRPVAEQKNSDEEGNDATDVRERELLAELEVVRRRKRAGKDIERPEKRVKVEPATQGGSGQAIDLTNEHETTQKPVKADIVDLT